MPKISITGQRGKKGAAVGSDLEQLFLKMLERPSESNERRFFTRYSSLVPNSEWASRDFRQAGQGHVEARLMQAVRAASTRRPSSAQTNSIAQMMRLFSRYGGEMTPAMEVSLRRLASRSAGKDPLTSIAANTKREADSMDAIRRAMGYEGGSRGRGFVGAYPVPALRPRSGLPVPYQAGAYPGFHEAQVRRAMGYEGGRGLMGGHGPPDGGGGGGGRALGPLGGSFPGFGPPGLNLFRIVSGILAAPTVASLIASSINTQGRFFSAVTEPARPYMSIRSSAFAAGRAGGFSGRELQEALGVRGELGAGNGDVPSWMLKLGMTPADLFQSLERFGIAPTSVAGAMGAAQALRIGALSPAFAGMAPGTAEGIAGQGVGLGMSPNTGAGIQRYLTQFAPVMERAVAGAMDRSRLINSMEGSLETLAKGGAYGASIKDISDIFEKLQSSSLMSGRTGEAAASLIQGASNFTAGAGRAPLPTMSFLMAMKAKGGLGSEDAVQKSLGLSDKEFAELKSKPDSALALQDVISLWKNPATQPLALQPLGALIAGKPNISLGVALSQSRKMSGGNAALGRQAAANQLGRPLAEVYGYETGTVSNAATGTLGFLKETEGYLTRDKRRPAGLETDVFAANVEEFQTNLNGAANSFALLTQPVDATRMLFVELNKALSGFNTTVQGARSSHSPLLPPEIEWLSRMLHGRSKPHLGSTTP